MVSFVILLGKMISHGAILITQIHRYAQHMMEQIVCKFLKDGI
jgi:hypothetical protein